MKGLTEHGLIWQNGCSYASMNMDAIYMKKGRDRSFVALSPRHCALFFNHFSCPIQVIQSNKQHNISPMLNQFLFK